MTTCTSCGHELGAGRFCTSCGAPVPSFDDWRTDTAERKLPTAAPRTPSAPADPRTPPTAVAPPPPPRYPLFADEVESYSAVGPVTPAQPPAPEPEAPVEARADAEPSYDLEDDGYVYDEERRSPVTWILATVAVLVVVAAAWWFLVRGADADSASDDRGSGGDTSQDGSDSAGTVGTDVARRASASAPTTAPPNEDVDGRQVSYDASNMLDGVPTTAWRTEGDATGTQLTFTLPAPTELLQVGMVNGYAKKSTDESGREFDWYRGNRRVNAVVWTFDDGTKVRQQLAEDTRMQLLDLPKPVSTTTVTATLVKVSAPGEGDAGRNYTAVSEVSLIASGAS